MAIHQKTTVIAGKKSILVYDEKLKKVSYILIR